MSNDLYLTAAQAAQILGVDIRTIYTYVSRKKLRTLRVAGRRESLYWRTDIEKFAGLENHAADTIFSSAQTTSVTLITPQGPYYRGHSAIELSENATLEEVAAILWEVEDHTVTNVPFELSSILGQLPQWRRMSVADQSLLALLLAENHDNHPNGFSRDEFAKVSIRSMKLFASVITGLEKVSDEPLHILIGKALDAPDALIDLIRRTLVLNADHELSMATCAVRAVADAGVTPYGVLSTGIGAYKGERVRIDVMRATAQLVTMIIEAQDPGQLVVDLVRNGQALAGFGFPVYYSKDPRAAALLTALEDCLGRDSHFLKFKTAIRIIEDEYDRHPDIVLVAAFLNIRLGGKSSDIPFSVVGRSAGWIAHAIERYTAYQHKRRRAAYVGDLPGKEGEKEDKQIRGRRTDRWQLSNEKENSKPLASKWYPT